MTAKLYITGTPAYVRREYRRLRKVGFTTNDATLVIYGMTRAAEILNLTMGADVSLKRADA